MLNNNVVALLREMDKPEETHVNISILTYVSQFSETTVFNCTFQFARYLGDLFTFTVIKSQMEKTQMVSQSKTTHRRLSGSGAVRGARREDSGDVCV